MYTLAFRKELSHLKIINATLLALFSDSSLPWRLAQNGLESKIACADRFYYMVSQLIPTRDMI